MRHLFIKTTIHTSEILNGRNITNEIGFKTDLHHIDLYQYLLCQLHFLNGDMIVSVYGINKKISLHVTLSRLKAAVS